MSESKKRQKKNKKDSQLIIRISGKERDSFIELCEDLDTSAAREIRQFIRNFIDSHNTEQTAEQATEQAPEAALPLQKKEIKARVNPS
jgi:hypothetical protein